MPEAVMEYYCEAMPDFYSMKRRVDQQIEAAQLKDIPEMTVKQHHFLTLGVLSGCYDYVPHDLRIAIEEALEAGKRLGMPILVDGFLKEKHDKISES